jgi:hypothetical protein
VGPFQGLERGTAAIRRSNQNQTTFPLTKMPVLAKRWIWGMGHKHDQARNAISRSRCAK